MAPDEFLLLALLIAIFLEPAVQVAALGLIAVAVCLFGEKIGRALFQGDNDDRS